MEAPADSHRRQFTPLREPLLALAGDAGGQQLLLEVRLELLDHEETVDGRREAADDLDRQGLDHAELEEGRVGQCFPGRDVGGAGRDDADARRPAAPQGDQAGAGGAGPRLHPGELAGERRLLGVLREALHALEQAAVQRPRVARQQAVLLGDAVRRLALGLGPAQAARVAVARDRRAAAFVVLVADAHQRLLVRRLDAQAHHDRHVELLAQVEGQPRELVALLAVGRLEHRHAADAPEVAVVLLGHAAGHAGVAGEAHHEAAVDARVHGADERVGGHAGPSALHRREGADAAHGRPERHLVGDLLVGGPLGVDAVVPRQVGDDLGARRARIGRRHLHAGLPGAARHGLVAQHQVRFHATPRVTGARRARPATIRRRPSQAQACGPRWRARCGLDPVSSRLTTHETAFPRRGCNPQASAAMKRCTHHTAAKWRKP